MPKAFKVPPKEPIEAIPWPQITMKKDLVAEVMEPEQIIVLDNFLTTQECHALIQFVDGLEMELTRPPKRGEATRVNHRTSITSPTFATTLFDLLSPHLPPLASFEAQAHIIPPPRPVLCNSNIRLYKYTEGQYFGPHYDESVPGPSMLLPTPLLPQNEGTEPQNLEGDAVVPSTPKRTGQRKPKPTAIPTPPQVKTWSEWTILIYLSGSEDGIVGGETAFYIDEGRGKSRTQRLIVPPLKRGSVLLHKHGKECLLHEGRTVQQGTKFVLRSDLMFGRVPLN